MGKLITFLVVKLLIMTVYSRYKSVDFHMFLVGEKGRG